MRKNWMVTASAVLSFVIGGLLLITTGAFAILGGPLGLFSNVNLVTGNLEPNSATFLPMVLAAGAGLLWIVVGAGLLRLARWAAIAAVVLGLVSGIAVAPLGVVLLVLLNWKSFSEAPQGK